jgi:hypothetical protein
MWAAMWLGVVSVTLFASGVAEAKTTGWTSGAGSKPNVKELIPKMASEEAYTERYVFSTDLDGGGHIGVDFTISNLGWGDGHGASAVRIYLPNEKRYDYKDKVNEGKWSYKKDTFHLDISKTQVWSTGPDTYRIKHDNGSVKLDLTLKSLVPMWRPGGGAIKVKDGYYKFTVVAPRAEVTGKVMVGGKWRDVKSERAGYAEHTATNVAPYDLATRFSRMRAVDDDVLIMWREVRVAKSYGVRSYTFAMVAYKDQVVFSDPGAAIKFGSLRRDAKTGYQVPLSVQIDGKSKEDAIKLVLTGTSYKSEDLLDSYGSAAKTVASMVSKPFRFTVPVTYALQMTIQGATATVQGKGSVVFDYVNQE